MKRMIHAAALALLVGGPLAATAAPLALAQDGEPDPMAERAESFQAAEGAQTENVPGGTLMVVAYGAIFTLVLGYAVSLAFRQARLDRDLNRLRQDLQAYDRANPSGELPPDEL